MHNTVTDSDTDADNVTYLFQVQEPNHLQVYIGDKIHIFEECEVIE